MMDPAVRRWEGILRKPYVLLPVGGVLGVLALAVLWVLFPFYRGVLSNPFWFPVVVMVIMYSLIMSSTAVCILAERKIAAYTQDRPGPNRVGFWGLLQPLADGMKFFFKEDITPTNVDRPLFYLAPALALVISLIGFAIIPWAGNVTWPWAPDTLIRTQVASLDIGVLYILAVGSLGVYGIVLAGYASNNKYSFFGGMRAAAQIISYELPMGLALLTVLLVAGTLRPELIVDEQAQSGLWNVFLQPVAFFLVLVCSFAEGNRAPFDLAEAEQELVGGFHTEYSSMKFALFFLGEYAHMITGSALMVALFFGGWHLWGLPGADNTAWWAMLLRFCVYLAKIAAFVFVFMWVRWTLPRFRFDQLMRVCWQSLLPVGIGVLVGTAILAAFNLQRDFWASLLLNVVLVAIILWYAARSKTPVTGRQSDLPLPV